MGNKDQRDIWFADFLVSSGWYRLEISQQNFHGIIQAF